jgi:peroxiredoxin Q/BCP
MVGAALVGLRSGNDPARIAHLIRLEGVKVLEKGMQAPEFEMADPEGTLWRLSELRGKKVVLYFYPADDTPGCTAEACDFRDSMKDFTDAGYVVLGVSPQGADSHRKFSGKYSLNFPLLIDENLAAARAYDSVREKVEDWEGIPLHVKRSTFVIDEEGNIEEALYGVRGKGHVAQLRGVLELNA